ncbi:MAG TPA: OmpA family protein [Polyangiaceae bacterium]|nr:OmpA family protein [Polyangiaceae bacterium]
MKRTSLLCLLTLLLAVACASTGPTPELVDARRAYDEARSSEAATYSPDKLLSAKQALERAEAVHGDDPGSFEERSLAYVAQRKAQYAALYGTYEKDRREQAETEQAYRQKQDTLRKNAERQATDAQKSLAATWDNLSSARREIAAQQTQIQKGQAELDAEKQARAKAEQSAAAAMASLSKIAQVKEEQRGVVITLEGAVLFVTGKSELLPIARDKLNEVAKALKDMDDGKLASIEGFTDSRGADDMNLKLSQDRASAVMNYLISQGVRADKLRAVGRGEASPVASNDTPEGRANNRRVEIIIQTTAQAVEGMKKQ